MNNTKIKIARDSKKATTELAVAVAVTDLPFHLHSLRTFLRFDSLVNTQESQTKLTCVS